MIVPEDPETSTLKWLFQLDDSKPLNGWKSPNIHLKQWLFRVPGIHKYIHIIKYIYTSVSNIDLHSRKFSSRFAGLQNVHGRSPAGQIGRWAP